MGIAQALLGSPKVIILDEPTVGLDPIQIIEIRDLIKELGREHTVIFSSHILSEVQAICDQILIIAHGHLAAFDTPDRLEQSLLSGNEIHFTAEAGADEVRELLAGLEHISDLRLEEPEAGRVSASLKTDSRDLYDLSRSLFFAFAERGRPLLELNLKKASLEDIFLELTGPAAGASEAPEEHQEQEEEEKQA